MIIRQNNISAISSQGTLVPQGGFVTPYPPGGIASEDSTGNVITMAAGHGFQAGDKILVGLDLGTYSGAQSIESVTASTITFPTGILFSVVSGDTILNLGADTGLDDPNYDGSTIGAFSTPHSTVPIEDSHIALGGGGEYAYYHTGDDNFWELVRSPEPILIVPDAYVNSPVRVLNAERYAHGFATSGNGTEASPWSVEGSNPVQAAIDDLPDSGGTVRLIPGYYDLGNSSVAVNIPILTDGSDLRTYKILGAGRDLCFLQYSGTGAAFRYAQVNAGAPGTSIQSNHMVFSGFAVQQTGTSRTGSAFHMTYLSESLFEELSIGCLRQHKQPADPDTGFEYGIRLEGGIGDNVVDFNRVDRCIIMGNTHAIFVQNQGDNTVIERCWFEPRQNIADTQSGVEIHNSYGCLIQGNHFNFFGKNSPSNYALLISGTIRGHQIAGNYFEGNDPHSIFIEGDEDKDGISITGNSFSFNQVTGAIGISVGQGSAVWKIRGVHISGNGFYLLSTGNTGIRIDSEVHHFVLASNGYNNTGGTNRTLVSGCKGTVMESFDNTNYQPVIHLVDDRQSQGRILLENMDTTSNEASPSIQMKPGGTGTRPSVRLQAGASGEFQILDDSGQGLRQWQQDGDHIHYPLTPNNTTTLIQGAASELLTLSTSGTTTSTSANLLPADSIIDAVVACVTTTITTATNWSVGVSGTPTRFASANATMTAGATSVGVNHMKGGVSTDATGPVQVAAAPVLITTTGTPGAGAIRIVVYYRQFTAPSA